MEDSGEWINRSTLLDSLTYALIEEEFLRSDLRLLSRQEIMEAHPDFIIDGADALAPLVPVED
jgi:hypothetical protein